MAEIENKITEKKKEEIIKALKVIQDICKSNENCETCPLRSLENLCAISDRQPDCWSIQGKDEGWRALL